jgi:hypothetical protein
MIYSAVGSLAKKEGYICNIPNRSGQFVDDTAQKHCLAFSGVTPDPEEMVILVVSPLFELLVVENPAI